MQIEATLGSHVTQVGLALTAIQTWTNVDMNVGKGNSIPAVGMKNWSSNYKNQSGDFSENLEINLPYGPEDTLVPLCEENLHIHAH